MSDLTSLRRRLYFLIELCFSARQLNELDEALGREPARANGQTLDGRITALLDHCERQGTLPALVRLCQGLRPQVLWPDVYLPGAPAGREAYSSLAQVLQQHFPDVWATIVSRGLLLPSSA